MHSGLKMDVCVCVSICVCVKCSSYAARITSDGVSFLKQDSKTKDIVLSSTVQEVGVAARVCDAAAMWMTDLLLYDSLYPR